MKKEVQSNESQLGLQYAQQVVDFVKLRRIEALQHRREELNSLPITHERDIELRDDLIRQIDAEIKQLKEQN